MKPEKSHLIHDLLDEQPDACRQATLLAGGRILRRRRWRRAVTHCAVAVAVLGIVAHSIQRAISTPPVTITVVPSPPAQPRGLTDDELLALFPKTPVGLATLENGKKRLIFPRPGDEDRFITRL